MAVPGGTQASIATFAFGFVALASSGAAWFFTFGSRRLRDNTPLSNGLRLVLVTFLLSAAFWSIIDFAATLTSGDANPACQILVAIAAAFDQLARLAFEQFLLWRIKLKKRSTALFILQVLIFVRFVMGGVLVAVQRPQAYPVCIAKNILVPLGIATLVTDALIVCILFVVIWMTRASIPPPSANNTGFAPAKIITFLTSGFAAWLATSIPLIFGLEMFPFVTRTVVPSIGLLLLLGLVVLFNRDVLYTQSDLQPPSSADTSKALPSRPSRSRDSDSSPEIFERPWGAGSQRLHIAQVQRPGSRPAPMPKPGSRGIDTALPIINRPAPGQTQRGVGGVPVQGQLFPPVRETTDPIVLQNPPKKRSNGKLAISNPVIRESSAIKILDRIPTVELAMAAKNDQERRAASRAMTVDGVGRNQTPTLNPQRSSFKRKEVASANNVPAMSSERSLLSPEAATTATQISPSVDEFRRRSPRTTLNISETLLSPPARSPRRPLNQALNRSDAGAPAIPPQSPLRKNGSASSVLRGNSGIFIDPSTPPAIPTPLRQENTTWPKSGSPESPLVPRVEPLPMPFPTPRPTTAPSYESPAAAAARASILTRSGPGSVRRDIRPSRQRPKSRNADDGQEPVPAKTPVQMRTANGIPLNPRAQPANEFTNGTRERGKTLMFSHTLDFDRSGEPVSRQIFALALANSSPSADSIVHRPRPIPRKRSIYKAEFTIKLSPGVYRHRLSRSGGSVELQRESMESEGDTISRIPSFPEPPKSAGAVLALAKYRKTSDSASKEAETPGSIDDSNSARASIFADPAPSNVASIDPKTTLSESTEFGSRASLEPDSAYGYNVNIRRQSSPVLPAEEMQHVSMANPVPQLEQNALVSGPSSARSGTSTLLQHDGDNETGPLILDAEPESSSTGPNAQRDSFLQQPGWHRRVGDECPTFSDRKNSESSSRRVLAPTPLVLGRSRRTTRIAETPEPPLESPQHALDIIQQQLKDLDEADSESGVQDKQRRRLLENLEAEMGAQETHWQDIRRNLADRSPSSTRSSLLLPSGGDLHLTSPRPSPTLESPDLGSPVIGRGADPTSARQNHTKPPPADEISDPAPGELTRRSNSGFTDQGSVQAIGEVENRARFGKSASRNNKDGLEPTTLTNEISAPRQLMNHRTAPETNKREEKSGQDEEVDSASARNNNFSAWTAPVQFAPVDKTPLPVSHWSIDSDTTALASEVLQRAQSVAQEPDSLVRTAGGTFPLTWNTQVTQAPQRIDKVILSPTSSLSPNSLPRESLVSPPASEQSQSPRRPVTQKPPRRSKRITLLPDIPESPQPVSNKRDTLGFFQFPWGETSDIATLQPQLSAFSIPLPGVTLNGFPLAQPYLSAQGPVLPSQVYPVSFFDHYSDDELPAVDSDEDYSDNEDYEPFDETTLQDIADMLQSKEVPSRDSLFPDSEEYRPPSRAGFISTDETTIFAVRQLPTPVLEESTLGSKDKELPPLPLPDSSVWKINTMYTTVTRSAGLAQPDAKTWRRYLGKQAETGRAAPRKSEPASITSSSLWSPVPTTADAVAQSSPSGLWRSPKDVPSTPASTTPSTPFLNSPTTTESSMSPKVAPVKTTTQSYGLWTPPAPVPRVLLGLPQDAREWSRYTAKKIQSSRPKPRPSVSDVIHSTALWTNPSPAAVAPAPVPAPKQAPASQLLWCKPATAPTEQTEGLWSASHVRRRYKTTEQLPAALHTARKLRIDRRPLAVLRSASLWSTTTQTPMRQVPDWLALSTTMRPVSPDSGASTLSDQDSASAFDSVSLRSEATAASSVAAAKLPAHRKTASKQAAQDELDAAFRDVMQAKLVVPEAVPEEESQPQQPEEKEELYFDVSRLHPVFAVDVLHVTSDNVHPAATGYLHSIINGAPKPRRR